MKKIELLDSTLRDGAQGEGISFSVNDRLEIVRVLDDLGIPIIEAGNPTSNPRELEFFERASRLWLKNSRLCAFGSTRRKGERVEEDAACAALLKAGTPCVSIVGKSRKIQVEGVLQTSLEENLSMIEETCRFFKSHGKYVVFDAEHFFDSMSDNDGYALESLRAALRGGVDCLALCDTNGGSFPDYIEKVTGEIVKAFPGTNIGIHTHNDSDMACAGALMAVRAGAKQVQGTFIGFGERCGNAKLTSIIPNLQIKSDYECIPQENLKNLTSSAIKIASIANVTLHRDVPFVGRSAFAHKAGMHADGVLKFSESFEHIDPESVGNRRRFLLSEVTGKAAVLKKIQKLYPDFDKDSPQVAELLDILKQKEYEGYQYEGADSSFELIVHRLVRKYKPFFDLISYKVLDELPYDNDHSATATIKLSVDGRVRIAASDGDGPVNALDRALREALEVFYPCLRKLRLIDYKVRVMEPKDATAASVRVLITSSDGEDIWTTVGVSQDVINASWIALVDSIEHKLVSMGEDLHR